MTKYVYKDVRSATKSMRSTTKDKVNGQRQGRWPDTRQMTKEVNEQRPWVKIFNQQFRMQGRSLKMQRQWLWGQTKDVKSMTERCEVRTRDATSRTAYVRWRTPYTSSTTKELKPTTQDVSRTGHVRSTTRILPAGSGATQHTLSTAAGVKVKCAQVASIALLLKFNQSVSTCSVLRRCFCSPQTVYLSVNGMQTKSMNYIRN